VIAAGFFLAALFLVTLPFLALRLFPAFFFLAMQLHGEQTR
jgi:hypothetical protein